MIRRKRFLSLLVSGAVGIGAVFAANGTASPLGIDLTERADGEHEVGRLRAGRASSRRSCGRSRSRRARRSSRTRRRSPRYYGYDNDVLNAAGEPQMVPTPTQPGDRGAQDRAGQEHLPASSRTAWQGADPSYDYGTHFLFQGHEGGRRRRRLHHAHQPRRRRRAPRDAAGDAGLDRATRSPRSTARPGTRGRSGCSSRPRARARRPTRRRPDYPVDGRRRLRRARPRRLRGHPERLRRQHLDRRGHRRLEQAGAHRRRSGPNSFVYRFVPAKPGDLRNGKLQVLQVLERAAASRSRSTSADGAQRARPGGAAHLRQRRSTRSWVTIHDTAVDGTAPFNANDARQGRRTATPFKRPENGQFRPGSAFKSSSSTRPATPNATSPENAGCGGWGSIFKLTQSGPSAEHRQADDASTRATRRTAGFDNVAFLSQNQIAFVEDAGDTLHSAAQRARLGATSSTSTPTTRTRRTSRSAGSPRAATRRRRSTPPTAASARTRATTRSPACTSPTATPAPAASSAPRSPIFSGRQVALVLHPAARRQHHLGGRPLQARRLNGTAGLAGKRWAVKGARASARAPLVSLGFAADPGHWPSALTRRSRRAPVRSARSANIVVWSDDLARP